MSTVNYTLPSLEPTVRVINDFYNFAADIAVNEYDLVYSFFRKTFLDDKSAKNFTATFFLIVVQTGQPVQDLLESIKNKDQISLTATFAYYLNNLRSNTTLLGISNLVTPNYYAARSVLP
jgi:hypothetical protein